jgi:hypothetical protein
MKKRDVEIKQMKLTMIKLKNPIKMSKAGKMMKSSNSIGLEDYRFIFYWRMEPS